MILCFLIFRWVKCFLPFIPVCGFGFSHYHLFKLGSIGPTTSYCTYFLFHFPPFQYSSIFALTRILHLIGLPPKHAPLASRDDAGVGIVIGTDVTAPS
jgi:hypothetical protein